MVLTWWLPRVFGFTFKPSAGRGAMEPATIKYQENGLHKANDVMGLTDVMGLFGVTLHTLNSWRLPCKPFQLHAHQQVLVIGLLKSLFCEAWVTSADAACK